MECHKLISRLAWRNSRVCTKISSEKCLRLLGYVWATQGNRWFSGASVCQLTFFWVWDSAKSAATLPKSGHELKGEKHCASRLSVNQTVFFPSLTSLLHLCDTTLFWSHRKQLPWCGVGRVFSKTPFTGREDTPYGSVSSTKFFLWFW